MLKAAGSVINEGRSMTDERCEDCYWGRFALDDKGNPSLLGNCMVDPPVPVAIGEEEIDSWRPVVGCEDYCSRFRSRGGSG